MTNQSSKMNKKRETTNHTNITNKLKKIRHGEHRAKSHPNFNIVCLKIKNIRGGWVILC